MIEVDHNNEWVEANVPQIDCGEVADYFQIIDSLRSRAGVLKNNIKNEAVNLAPTTGSTPSLKKRYSAAGYAPQGGCTDGTYIYFYISYSDYSNPGTFVKMNLSDYSEVTTKTMDLFHGNDMCYNPDTGYIYVSTMYVSGGQSRIDVIDPTTLTLIAQKYLPAYTAAISYNPNSKLFVGGSTSLSKPIFRLNDSDEFELIKTLTITESPSYSANRTSQGMTCDSAFIYHAWAYSPNIYIEICDWLGNYIRTIHKSVTYSTIDMEIEFIEKKSKNELLLGTYGTGQADGTTYIYTMTLS